VPLAPEATRAIEGESPALFIRQVRDVTDRQHDTVRLEREEIVVSPALVLAQELLGFPDALGVCRPGFVRQLFPIAPGLAVVGGGRVEGEVV